MNDSLDFGSLEADYVLTDEEMEQSRSEESMQQIQQNVDEARMERMSRESAVQAAEEAAAAPIPQVEQPPTGAQQSQQQTPAGSTDQPLSGETVTFNNGKTYAVEHIEYINGMPFVKPEFNELYSEGQGNVLGQNPAEFEQQVRERTSAAGQGLFDFATDLFNKFLPKGAQIPKATEYEDGVANAARAISSVVTPTLMLQSAGMSAGTAAQQRVGWSLGNTSFMRFLGSRGVEALAGVTVGAVSSEYEEDNLTGTIKKVLPAQWDFIPDNMATLDTDSPDIKRQKNINEDLALGFLIPFVGAARKFGQAIGEVKDIFNPRIVPNTPKAQSWLAEAAPAADDLDDITRYGLKQEDNLDELGAYNLAINPNMDVSLKGVHDLYDWNEIGIRSVDDFGIVGASLDAVRIAKNYDTVYGRLGSVASTPAIKYAVSTPKASEELVVGLTRQLKDADEYGMEAANWSIKFDEVVAEGANLAVELFDPSMGVKELRQILDPYIVKGQNGAEYVAEEGYSTLFRAIDNYSEDITGLDIARAQSYLATSLSGQVSDLAEGMRINRGSRSVFSAQERVKENLQYLMKLRGITRYYAQKKANTNKLFNKLSKNGIDPTPIVADDAEIDEVLKSIQKEVEVFGENLDYLKNTHPQTAEALMELYELTDGRVNSIQKLNEEIQYSFTKFRPLYDQKPEAPNILLQAVRGNFFNSILSSIGTGAQALYGNLGGTIAEPLTYFAGATMRWDTDSLQRGWMAYSALWDTQKKAVPYAGKLFMKASQNPNSVSQQTRLDAIIQQEEKLSAFKKIADEQAAQGNEGFKYLINFYENMKAMEADPVFRLIPNSFTGFDGLTNATVANSHARFRAMSELKRLGEEVTPARIKELADAEYNSMFDANGIIVDKAVRYNSNEIALNLDTDMVKSFDEFLKRWPGARMFLMFPGTMANMLKQADDFSPLPLRSFQEDINDLAYTSVADLAGNPELMDQLLSRRGYDPTKMDEGLKLDTIIDLKNKTLGKKGFGTIITGTIVTGLLLNKIDITGDGLYDRSAQRSREANTDWERRTIKIGDKRVNYETILGPGLANWVAAVVNVADNFDMLGEAKTEQLFEKLAFTLGGAITNQALTSSLRPLVELASGNGFEASRWSAGIVNSLGPLGGLRNEMGRVLDGGLKIIEGDFISHIENRNQMIGVIDPANRLPYLYNPVTGQIPNQYTLPQRLWNAYSPIKIYPGQTDEERFLQDIEFDIATTFKKRQGVELEPAERSELFRIMGQQGFFKQRIKAIKNTAESKRTIESLREARRRGVTSEQTSIDSYDRIHYLLGVALRDAEKLAYAELDSDMKIAIEARRQAAAAAKRAAEAGRIPALEETAQIRK